MSHFPAFLDLRGRRCLVVGATLAAARKAALLARSGADVWHVAQFAPADLDGCVLAIGAGDDAAGCFRSALLHDGRLAACLFIAPTIDLPARERFAALFAAQRLGAAEQAVLLAGRSPSGAVDGGKIVCACFGVGREALRDVIAQGLATTEAIGTALKAGTNCGSCLPEIRALLAQAPAAAE